MRQLLPGSRTLTALGTALLLTGCGWFGGDDVEERATGKAAEKAEGRSNQ